MAGVPCSQSVRLLAFSIALLRRLIAIKSLTDEVELLNDDNIDVEILNYSFEQLIEDYIR